MSSIGLFAGTFDPVHDGHILFAKQAIQAARLDKVVIVAEKEPYRKKPYASWDHRQAMIERATEGLLQIDHDYQFASQLAHQHTMKDMLSIANQHYGNEHEYWFLVGSDTFEHMHQWGEIAEKSKYNGFVVAFKNDHTKEWLQQKMSELEKIGMNTELVIIENTNPTVSSSSARSAIKANKPTVNLAPKVSEYIQKHQLYQ